jgi:2',3'-cyclic-nucleotide 2'-phosphodiesterase
MRFLILGDVVGRPGREAVSEALPALRAELAPDHVIINVENMAHGNGVSPETWREAAAWEADVCTTGDHAWDNEQGLQILDDATIPIIRPANYGPSVPGRGWHVFTSGAYRVAVINLQGQVFFKNHPASPFATMDQLLKEPAIAEADVILVDFQAEATSEKRALGWHLDGRITTLWGTHTHVPTADAQILPKGTGYISDIGMTGLHHSVIGADPEASLRHFKTQLKVKLTYDTGGPKEVGALVFDVDPAKGTTTAIQQVRKILN